MSLVPCRECGREVSDQAMQCPHCGTRLRQPRRGLFGQIFKLLFIGFNILMIVWIVSGLANIGALHPASEAEKVGHAIGATFGIGMLLSFWVMGDIILGMLVLFTRPKG